MLTSEEIKKAAREFGADLVGIGSVDRFEGTPPERDPRFIAPRARSIIGLGFRVLRGSLRGVEEGTHEVRFDAETIEIVREVLEAAYPQVRFGYNPSLCGAASQRACLSHLEAKGILTRTFTNAFRP